MRKGKAIEKLQKTENGKNKGKPKKRRQKYEKVKEGRNAKKNQRVNGVKRREWVSSRERQEKRVGNMDKKGIGCVRKEAMLKKGGQRWGDFPHMRKNLKCIGSKVIV